MRRYLVRRIFTMVPTLVVLILISFILLNAAPGDPVERMMTTQVSGDALLGNEVLQTEQKKYWLHRLGLDLPVFYFSIQPAAELGFKSMIPALTFHRQNQFQRWLFGDGMNTKGILRGDFGISYATKQPVSALISDRIGWTIFLTFFSVLFAYLISIPLGMQMAAKPGSAFERRSSMLLIILYSLPGFWVATLLLITFSNPDVLSILPASGVKPVGGFPEIAGWMLRVKMSIPYLILPTICYTYGSLVFLSRTLKVTLLENLQQDYIRTARAKGLDEKIILRKHAFRNALLPLITVFSHVFPVAVSGSVILETIFTIPGMGLTLFQSMEAQDYPVVIAVFTLTGILTLVGFLISDLLYAWADPRISFSKTTTEET